MKTIQMAALSIALMWLVHCAAAEAEAPIAVKAADAQPDAAIVAKLRELITVREAQAEQHQILFQSGRASGEPTPEVALAEARIELARELGQGDGVLTQLRKIVELRREWLQFVQDRVADRMSQQQLSEAQAALLQAEIRLLREQKRSR